MFLGVGFGMLLWCMDIKVEIDGEEIVVKSRGFFFHAPPKEQVADRVIAAFAWSY